MSLLSATAVRERAQDLLVLGVANGLPHFKVDLGRLAPTADFVASVIRDNYPALKVPLHARWRHFVFGGRNLWSEIVARTAWRDASARARAAFDLAIVSVLLDAGAGASWRYRDRATGFVTGRSEGLALASLRMFEAGLFSDDTRDPFRADASRLAMLTGADLARGFQTGTGNPLTGLDGRAALLARLGQTMRDNPGIFARADGARAGGLFDHLAAVADGKSLSASAILHALLLHLGPIWTGRLTLGGIPLGDTWRHRGIKRNDASNGLMPLHKLSQWLSYSLIEPMRQADIAVTDIDGLTGLAEYRNGGLFIDAGVIAPRTPVTAPLPVDCEAVVEWRALTVTLIDRLLPLVRERLTVSAADFPLGALLEGGTWAAGRKLATEKRADGRPPIEVISDGTVF